MSAHVLVRVPGKINLQLSVGPLQKDGFHPVATVFQAVSIFDDVKVELNDDGLVHVQSTAKTNNHLPLDKENLAAKAVELMRKKFDISDGITITLTKEIPIAGGMAGGSANAGAAIVGMDALFNLGLKRNDMEKIGAELGADVPFTISGGTAIGTGKGDQITPVNNAVAKPMIHSKRSGNRSARSIKPRSCIGGGGPSLPQSLPCR